MVPENIHTKVNGNSEGKGELTGGNFWGGGEGPHEEFLQRLRKFTKIS